MQQAWKRAHVTLFQGVSTTTVLDNLSVILLFYFIQQSFLFGVPAKIVAHLKCFSADSREVRPLQVITGFFLRLEIEFDPPAEPTA